MEEIRQTDADTWLVVDDTTIYEVDVNCYRCLPAGERPENGPDSAMMHFPEDVLRD